MKLHRASVGIAFAAAIFVAVLVFVRIANAHVMGVSRGEYTLNGKLLRAEIVLRADDAILAVSGLDADGNGLVSQPELDRARTALEAAFFEPLSVLGDASRCAPALDAAALDPPEGLSLRATYACANSPTRLRLRFGFLDRMPSAHRHLATVHLPRGDVDALIVLARPELDVLVSEASSHGFVSLFRGGIEHILTGADHLAFLLALVLGGTLARAGLVQPLVQPPTPPLRRGLRALLRGSAPADALSTTRAAGGARPLPPDTPQPIKEIPVTGVRLGPLVGMLTAFTLGHSLSLGVATLGGFAPGAHLIEPAVALSVAYVGAENLFARSVTHRWLLTFPFGLVHGFAFAGGLLPLGLPRSQLPVALFAFNLGVEAGQLCVLATLLPPLAWLRKRPWYGLAARGLSAAIAVAGLVWFFQRLA